MAHAELEESERRARQQISNRAIIRPTAAEIAQMEAAFRMVARTPSCRRRHGCRDNSAADCPQEINQSQGICQLTDSPPASHKRTNHMARGIQKHVIRREAVLSQNPNWRSRRLPRIAIGARATDKLTARLLSLEFLDRLSIITPREAAELESLQCIQAFRARPGKSSAPNC
jgi:hypothetical protein